MSTLKLGLISACFASAMAVMPTAMAAPMKTTPAAAVSATAAPLPCTKSNVQLTGVFALGSSENNLSKAVGASQCGGAYEGSDRGNDRNASNAANFGQLNDGLLNGESGVIPADFFLGGGTSRFLDLNGDGTKEAPGWIYLGTTDSNGFDGYGQIKNTPISNFVTLDVQGLGTTSGTWKVTPKDDIVQTLSKLIGNSVFDSLAIILKVGKEFAVYDFDFLTDPNLPKLDLATPFQLSGTWKTDDFKNKPGVVQTLSHLSYWAHDPIVAATTEIPEPTTLALLGLSLLGIGAASRRRKS